MKYVFIVIVLLVNYLVVAQSSSEEMKGIVIRADDGRKWFIVEGNVITFYLKKDSKHAVFLGTRTSAIFYVEDEHIIRVKERFIDLSDIFSIKFNGTKHIDKGFSYQWARQF